MCFCSTRCDAPHWPGDIKYITWPGAWQLRLWRASVVHVSSGLVKRRRRPCNWHDGRTVTDSQRWVLRRSIAELGSTLCFGRRTRGTVNEAVVSDDRLSGRRMRSSQNVWMPDTDLEVGRRLFSEGGSRRSLGLPSLGKIERTVLGLTKVDYTTTDERRIKEFSLMKSDR